MFFLRASIDKEAKSAVKDGPDVALLASPPEDNVTRGIRTLHRKSNKCMAVTGEIAGMMKGTCMIQMI